MYPALAETLTRFIFVSLVILSNGKISSWLSRKAIGTFSSKQKGGPKAACVKDRLPYSFFTSSL